MTTELTNDLDVLRRWVGRTQESTDIVSVATCTRIAHTLDRPDAPEHGQPLPPLWHFAFHAHSTPLRELGPDGHPGRGGFTPPIALPRRMWAGSRVRFEGDVRIGDEVSKTSTIEDIVMKSGRSGDLCFLTVRHELSVEGEVRITESQDIVYREDPPPDAPAPEPRPVPGTADFERSVEPSEIMLFRYSAITFNGHRIHYDRDYARDVEGYGGLVVHGPLTATLLADLVVSEFGRRLAAFSFRGVAPLFDRTPFGIAGRSTEDGAEVWAATPSGALAMQAEATFR